MTPTPGKPALSGWELCLWSLAATLVLAHWLLVPLVRPLDPVLAVLFADEFERIQIRQRLDNLDKLEWLAGRTPVARDTEVVDPWGRPYRWRPQVPSRYDVPRPELPINTVPSLMYSVGPDGVDDEGSGDDIESTGRSHPARAWIPDQLRVLLPVLGLLLLGWAGATGRWARAPRSSLRSETLRALGLAAYPASWGVVWAVAARDPDGLVVALGGHRLLGGGALLSLSWALLWILFALGWRLSRPAIEPVLAN